MHNIATTGILNNNVHQRANFSLKINSKDSPLAAPNSRYPLKYAIKQHQTLTVILGFSYHSCAEFPKITQIWLMYYVATKTDVHVNFPCSRKCSGCYRVLQCTVNHISGCLQEVVRLNVLNLEWTGEHRWPIHPLLTCT